MSLELVTLPCLEDNFAYLVHDPQTGATAVVDCPEAGPILDALSERNWQLSDILLTHHHHDHVEGVEQVKEQTGAKVTGAAADAHRLPPLDVALSEGEQLHFAGETAEILDVPGHTVGHIAYHFAASKLAFVGDCMMIFGCGRVFEGTMEQAYTSLQKIAALPGETMIASGHELAEVNLKFALSLGDDNPSVEAHINRIAARLAEGLPSVPSLLSDELEANPFLRCHDPKLRAAIGMRTAEDVDVFKALRERRNRF